MNDIWKVISFFASQFLHFQNISSMRAGLGLREKGGKRTAPVYFNRLGQHVPKHAHRAVAPLHQAIGFLEK